MIDNKFEYPISADRIYTVEIGSVKHKVSGDTLVKAYKAYMADSLPSDIPTPDDDESLF